MYQIVLVAWFIDTRHFYAPENFAGNVSEYIVLLNPMSYRLLIFVPTIYDGRIPSVLRNCGHRCHCPGNPHNGLGIISLIEPMNLAYRV